MTFILRSYSKTLNNRVKRMNNYTNINIIVPFSRCYSDILNGPEYTNTTILVENGYSFQELPVIVRKSTDLDKIEQISMNGISKNNHESVTKNYQYIQEEFKKCKDLRKVFAFLTKCTKITPNIALGALERINELEKPCDSSNTSDPNMFINFAKGAILDRLQRVIIKTEDTQTILHVLKNNSSFMIPFKHKFSDELTFRAIDNQLTLEQLCNFTMFLISNNKDEKYCETADRLWVGFLAKENNINESNIVQLFNVLPGLKASKRTLLNLLEQKLFQIWDKMKAPAIQQILHVFIVEKYFSPTSFPVFGHWMYMNIHSLDEDTFLDLVTKFTHLKYHNEQIVAAIEKYVKLKGSKISSYVLITAIYNFCMAFKLCNKHILNVCSEYFIHNVDNIPTSFFKSCIYPHGYLNSEPTDSRNYWVFVEDRIIDRIEKKLVNRIDDICEIVLAYMYLGHHPLRLVDKIFHPEFISKIKNPETYKKLQLIDTALSLECKEIFGPMLPKDQCYSPISQDIRISNILMKIKTNLFNIVGNSDMLSTAVQIPNYCSDSTYLIDVMTHPPGLSTNMFNGKIKNDGSDITAILIHLPEHFCSDGENLIGSQIMRIRHMKVLGLKVVSLKYSILTKLTNSTNESLLESYILESMHSKACDNVKDV